MAKEENILEKSYGKNSLELIREILDKYGLEMIEGEGLQPSSIENGGFILPNLSPNQALLELCKMTGNSTLDLS